MQSDDFIDFARGDAGLWVLPVCFFVYLLIRTRRDRLVGVGFSKVARTIFSRLLIAASLWVAFLLFLTVWNLPPGHQYFHNLRIGSDRVTLGYRWPKPEVVIPVREITEVAVVREKTCYRFRIQTQTGTLRSFGAARFNEDEQRVFKKLQSLVEANHPKALPLEAN